MSSVLSNGLRVLIVAIATLFLWLAAYFFTFKEATGFNDHRFLGAMAIVSAVTILLPEIIFLHRRVRIRFNGRFRVIVGAAIAFPIILSWLGTFRWYRAGWEYDSLVHFISSGIGAFLVLPTLMFFGVSGVKLRVSVFMLFVIIVFIGGTANELFEHYGDLWWGTSMFGEPGQPDDTVRDILYNVLGASLGSIICLWRGDSIIRYLQKSDVERSA